MSARSQSGRKANEETSEGVQKVACEGNREASVGDKVATERVSCKAVTDVRVGVRGAGKEAYPIMFVLSHY